MNGTIGALAAILLWICILGLLTPTGCHYHEARDLGADTTSAAQKESGAEVEGTLPANESSSAAEAGTATGVAQIPGACPTCSTRFVAVWCACSPGITQRVTGRIWMDEREKK